MGFYLYLMVSHNSTYKKWNSYRILFRGKRVYLKENPRKGFCMKCGKTGKTNIHHEKYDDADPLKYIVELCISCHWYESVEMKQIHPDMLTKKMNDVLREKRTKSK